MLFCGKQAGTLNVSKNHYELFPERGTWKEGWRTVKVAIDERGRATFYDLFHMYAKFKRCDECPHKWW